MYRWYIYVKGKCQLILGRRLYGGQISKSPYIFTVLPPSSLANMAGIGMYFSKYRLLIICLVNDGILPIKQRHTKK